MFRERSSRKWRNSEHLTHMWTLNVSNADRSLYFSDSDTSVWRDTVWYYSSGRLTNFRVALLRAATNVGRSTRCERTSSGFQQVFLVTMFPSKKKEREISLKGKGRQRTREIWNPYRVREEIIRVTVLGWEKSNIRGVSRYLRKIQKRESRFLLKKF